MSLLHAHREEPVDRGKVRTANTWRRRSEREGERERMGREGKRKKEGEREGDGYREGERREEKAGG